MFVGMLSLGFVACGDDDDDGSAIVGTWSGNDYGDNYALTFKSNGSGTWVSRTYSHTIGTFTWSMKSSSKGSIVLKLSDIYSGDDKEYLYFRVEGTTMYIYVDEDYKEGAEWVLTKE